MRTPSSFGPIGTGAATGPDEHEHEPGHRLSPAEAIEWQNRRIKDLWRIFRIMSEFVDGFETMSSFGPCVSVFGSSRTPLEDRYYQMATDVSKALVQRDFGIITGGGPGIMEAANRGAQQGGGVSIGMSIVVPHEKAANEFVDHDKLVAFDFFFVRKVMLVKYAQGFVVLPGGYGTLDELFESLTLIQTNKSDLFPVVLMGTDYWGGLVDWLKETVLRAGNIAPSDLDLFHLTDDPNEAAQIIDAFYREHALSPNF